MICSCFSRGEDRRRTVLWIGSRGNALSELWTVSSCLSRYNSSKKAENVEADDDRKCGGDEHELDWNHTMPTPRRLPIGLPRTSPVLQRRYGSAPTPPARRSVVDSALIALAGLSITGFLLYKSKGSSDAMKDSAEEGERSSFTVPVVAQTGGTSTKTLTLLSQAETNARLKENEASFAVSRRNNPLLRYDTNNLASNSPIEDDSCCVILERDSASKVKGDLVFFGVFDGHGGWQTSRLLSSSLVSYVARELDLVFRGTDPYLSLADLQGAKKRTGGTSAFWSLFGGSPPAPRPQLDKQDPIVQSAIRNAFVKMDQEIVSAPVRLLDKLQKEGKLPNMSSKDSALGVEQSEALATLLPALSGSCALLAFLDAGRNKLHVACTGDSRAVMGVWVPDSTKEGGKWRVEPLSEDQTGRNPHEVERIQKEHPAEEKDTVIVRGRVLGGLEPTRAFGDARYKWPPGTQKTLAAAFHPGSVRGPPRNYHSPPYVTATPEIVSVDLSADRPKTRKSIGSFLPVSDPAEPPATRFLVLATDGLYDRLDNQEIVSLVGAHLCGVRGAQTRQAVLAHASDPTAVSGPHASHQPRQEPTRGEGESFTFEDGNLSTHLIRNALGGAKRDQVSVLLSIPAPLSRRYRDDITCTVILLGDPARDGEGGSGGVYRREEGFETPLKAKL
ncbi:hypothetical protein C6P46_006810 [Rhodotorula mucilaginosa]|uniref:PPM-type phosphatase domain-containing protein n=1 Tax=Rhodotorula mucilaginosa TaxID=5537 RepID=A0A9P6W8T1_RHOMI|nr:hypothetical protein C6P46_006810 [Rhodotorula mucilaginosa]